MRKPSKTFASDEQRTRLRFLASSHKVEKRAHLRSRIILDLAAGLSPLKTAAKNGVSKQTVHKWKSRWVVSGEDGLKDAPRPGNGRRLTPETKARIISFACSKPGDGRKRRTQREIAGETGVSNGSVWKTLRENALRPHKTHYWCGKSPDPEFAAKATDIIGLYMNPPENALVLCVDEKTQIQALDRTQPVLPALAGSPERQTVTYKRNGTASLIAALSTVDGEITASAMERNTAENFLKFLKKLYRKYPRKQLHIIADNLSAHKQKDVKAWIASKRRLSIHYTPTYASWLNQVEIFFSILARRVLKDAVWKSKKHLVDTVMFYIKNYNENNKKTFKWTYDISQLNTRSQH